MFEEDNFYTISKTANLVGVQTHVLRFWEKKFSHLNPKKGIGGRRYYSSIDIEKLKSIKNLLHDQGFTIPGAVKHLSKEEIENNPIIEENKKVKQLLDYAISSLDKAKNIIKSY